MDHLDDLLYDGHRESIEGALRSIAFDADMQEIEARQRYLNESSFDLLWSLRDLG